MLLFLAGCGVVTISERGEMTERMRTLTEQHAWERVDQHIADAVAALPVTPRLEAIPPNLAIPCDDPSDLGPQGRVSVAKVYWLRELPTCADPRCSWKTTRDAFRMSLQTNVRGELTISATSPCVWPQGTPPPEVVGR